MLRTYIGSSIGGHWPGYMRPLFHNLWHWRRIVAVRGQSEHSHGMLVRSVHDEARSDVSETSGVAKSEADEADMAVEEAQSTSAEWT